jgi:hypothetical protein
MNRITYRFSLPHIHEYRQKQQTDPAPEASWDAMGSILSG